MKKLRVCFVALSQRSSLLELPNFTLARWGVRSSDGRGTSCLSSPPPRPPTTTHLPGRRLFQHSQLHAVFYSITCCVLPTGTLKAEALIVKLPCDLICLISFEHGDNGCCISSICRHLFFCTCHLPDNKGGSFSQGVRPVSAAELQQPVIPQGLPFPTKAWSHWSHIVSSKKSSLPTCIQALSTHPAASCQVLLTNHSVAPCGLKNLGQVFFNVTALFVLGPANSQPHLQPLPCRFILDSSWTNPQSSPPNSSNAGSTLSPSLFPPLEIPTPPQDSANMLKLFRTSWACTWVPIQVGFLQSLWLCLVPLLLPWTHSPLFYPCYILFSLPVSWTVDSKAFLRAHPQFHHQHPHKSSQQSLSLPRAHNLVTGLHFKWLNWVNILDRALGIPPLSWGFILKSVIFPFLAAHVIKWWLTNLIWSQSRSFTNIV